MKIKDLSITDLRLKTQPTEAVPPGIDLSPALAFSQNQGAEAARGQWVAVYCPRSLTYDTPERDLRPSAPGCIYGVLRLGTRVLPADRFMASDVFHRTLIYISGKQAGERFKIGEHWGHGVAIAEAWWLNEPASVEEVWRDRPGSFAHEAGPRTIPVPSSVLDALAEREVTRRDPEIPSDLPPLAVEQIRRDRAGSGYTVEQVGVPDTVYAIEDPRAPGLLKVGSGTGDCMDRLDEAKRWTAGRARWAGPHGRWSVGTGFGRSVEQAIHDRLRAKGYRCEYGEWFQVPLDKFEMIIIDVGLHRRTDG